jgi:hypothetical protein
MKDGKEQDLSEALGTEKVGIVSKIVAGYMADWVSSRKRRLKG